MLCDNILKSQELILHEGGSNFENNDEGNAYFLYINDHFQFWSLWRNEKSVNILRKPWLQKIEWNKMLQNEKS